MVSQLSTLEIEGIVIDLSHLQQGTSGSVVITRLLEQCKGTLIEIDHFLVSIGHTRKITCSQQVLYRPGAVLDLFPVVS